MSTLNHIVGQIQSVVWESNPVRRETQSKELEAMLSTRGTQLALRQNVEEINDCVASLSWETNQLGCLFLLASRGETARYDDDSTETTFFMLSRDFLLSLKPGDYIGQSKTCRKKLVQLCKATGRVAIQLQKEKYAIKPLLNGIECCTQGRIQCVTPIHALVFQLCLMTECFSVAEKLLSYNGLIQCPEDYLMTPRDILLYFYYGGMICTGLKDYEKAMDMFVSGIVTPLVTVSAIVVEALKKYILVSLLVYGCLKQLPSYASGAVQKVMKSECGEYLELAKHIEATESIDAFVQEHESVWQNDGNFGLVKSILHTKNRRLMENLGKIYSVLPVPKLRQELALVETESVDIEMLRLVGSDAGEFRIDEENRCVFLSEMKPSSTSMHKIIEIIEKCASAKEDVDSEYHAIVCNPKYAQTSRLQAEESLGDLDDPIAMEEDAL